MFEGERTARARLRDRYRKILSAIRGVTVQEVGPNVTQSEQYFLIRIDPNVFGRHRDEIKAELDTKNIFCRKYFYPLCTDYVPYRNLPIVSTRQRPYAEIAKDEVLCLPFHSGVTEAQIHSIGSTFTA